MISSHNFDIHQSNLFNLGCNDGLVVFLNLLFTLFDKVFLAVMIFGESVVFAVGAVAFVALKPEKSDFFVADETLGVVALLGREWWLWVFHGFDLFDDLFGFEVLPGL